MRYGSKTDRLSRFLALRMPGLSPEKTPASIQALTPRVMRWDDEIWLLDLSPCESYWLAQAAMRHCDVNALLRLVLQDVATSTEAGRWRCAMASHPWQALLLLNHMCERRLTGLISGDSGFGRGVFKEISWGGWWRSVETLLPHFESDTSRRFNQTTFRRQSLQLQRTAKRMGLSLPWQMQEIKPLAMRRRYGTTMHDLWCWSFDERRRTASPRTGVGLFVGQDDLERDVVFAADFPWTPYVFADKPTVTHHLEFPLWEWEHIEPFLREDLDRLCSLACWQAGECIVSLEWRIVFRDLTHLKVPIRFRHPHSLHAEIGLHKTTLLQALYSFESSVPGSPLDAARHDELLPIVPLISWELIVDERLIPSSKTIGLFGDQISDGEATGLLSLLKLENKLSVPLACYSLRQDWLPEHSYAAGERTSQQLLPLHAAEDDQNGVGSFSLSLAAMARQRPLFLYEKPIPYVAQESSVLWGFCERTMTKWWARGAVSLKDASPSLQRDYYQLLDQEKRRYWVFKDNQGQCFLHGVFA